MPFISNLESSCYLHNSISFSALERNKNPCTIQVSKTIHEQPCSKGWNQQCSWWIPVSPRIHQSSRTKIVVPTSGHTRPSLVYIHGTPSHGLWIHLAAQNTPPPQSRHWGMLSSRPSDVTSIPYVSIQFSPLSISTSQCSKSSNVTKKNHWVLAWYNF